MVAMYESSENQKTYGVEDVMDLILSRVPARSVARWRKNRGKSTSDRISPELSPLEIQFGRKDIKGTGLFWLSAGIGDKLRVHNSSYGLFLVSSKIDIPSNFYVVNLLLFLVETTIGMGHKTYNVILYYSYGTTWSSTPSPTVKFQGGVFHKEILYWITDVQGQALTFHLETKNWATISLPETPTNRFCRPRLIASTNFLHYFITRNSIEDLCVFEITDSGGIIILVQGFVTCYDPKKQRHMFLNLERRFPVRGADVSGGDVEAFEVTDSLVPV
ncbi:hypothetical protein PanWU01x14_041450 [Parasponia andersonii]|uniref:Uncharacterized protein n=1 Tax=Parasponia andersonii TaxID=3476 RepID=A0A2P5DQG4_PARAD|nr:hypothetical protein PanWU01x14_041450 [Parasponia andersonii]